MGGFDSLMLLHFWDHPMCQIARTKTEPEVVKVVRPKEGGKECRPVLSSDFEDVSLPRFWTSVRFFQFSIERVAHAVRSIYVIVCILRFCVLRFMVGRFGFCQFQSVFHGI